MGSSIDFISCMPDETLHHILTFVPINLAIRTSVLSRRWRHVWCETSCLDFVDCVDFKGYRRAMKGREINQTLLNYRAPKITSFKLRMSQMNVSADQFESWIEFAMSRNVERLSLALDCYLFWFLNPGETYRFPNLFYLSSSLKQLCMDFIPRCTVSWKSLRKLTLTCWYLDDDESMANVLSGCPILETLELDIYLASLERLDLSKSLSLRRLKINRDLDHRYDWGPAGRPAMEIVAPHIHYLRLRTSEVPCTLVDVSSLTRAKLYIGTYGGSIPLADFLQIMVLNMLAKFQNVETLTFNGTVLQILSLAELCGVPLPTFKVQTLIVETDLVRSVIPGIARLLQNSPGLKKLIAHVTFERNIKESHLDSYLDSQGLNPDQCWRPKYEVFSTSEDSWPMLHGGKENMLKILPSFMEMVLRNGKTLETLVVGLKYIHNIIRFDDAKLFEELLQMIGSLSNNNNVSIVLKR